MENEIQHIKNIKKQYEHTLLKVKNVVAVGIGMTSDQRNGIIISVVKESQKTRSKIPNQIEGIPVEVKITGKIKAQ